MSKESAQLDANQIVYLPRWARFAVMSVLGALAFSATVAAIAFFFFPDMRAEISPTFAVAQTAAGAFAVLLFILFAERQLSTDQLLAKTDSFLEVQMLEVLRKIEVPQIRPGVTLNVDVVARAQTVHGGRKDIFGANYELGLEGYRMRMWIGINVKRLSVIYFLKATGEADAADFEHKLRFTFGGAAKLGYDTNFQYVELGDEKIVSVWTTVMADQAILGNPAEQLFWMQDVAMMTQSVVRTAVRDGIDLYTTTEPGPL